MIVRFAQELDAAGLVELVETVEDFGGDAGELLEDDAGQGEGHAEAAVALADVVQQHLVSGKVALLGHLFDQFGVLEVVEIVPVGVEDAVAAKAKGLMNLEIEADCGHDFGVLSSGVALYR